MFRFANPEYLYLLLIIPILLGLFIWANKSSGKICNALAIQSYWHL